MKSQKEKVFITTVRHYYKKYGRHDLPWRLTTDPYRIVVSEVMLQQTQVSRVIEKYHLFIKTFPTVQRLAKAPLQKVLQVWSGLGYNRRAKFLWHMAQVVTKDHKGVFPSTAQSLRTLPGIGAYTAGAIMAFAYNKPGLFIETNIRTVFIQHFFKDSTNKISDKELSSLIESTLDKKHPREWYWALMDYGAHLKSQGIQMHRHSLHYKKQSVFKGSTREVRGAIMKMLTVNTASKAQFKKALPFEENRLYPALEALQKEHMIVKKGQYYHIA